MTVYVYRMSSRIMSTAEHLAEFYLYFICAITFFIYVFASGRYVNFMEWLQRKYFIYRLKLQRLWRRLRSRRAQMPRIPYWLWLYIRSLSKIAAAMASLFSLLASLHFSLANEWIGWDVVLMEVTLVIIFLVSVAYFGRIPELSEYFLVFFETASISLLFCGIYPFFILQFRMASLYLATAGIFVRLSIKLLKSILSALLNTQLEDFPQMMNGPMRNTVNPQHPFELWEIDLQLAIQMMEANEVENVDNAEINNGEAVAAINEGAGAAEVAAGNAGAAEVAAANAGAADFAAANAGAADFAAANAGAADFAAGAAEVAAADAGAAEVAAADAGAAAGNAEVAAGNAGAAEFAAANAGAADFAATIAAMQGIYNLNEAMNLSVVEIPKACTQCNTEVMEGPDKIQLASRISFDIKSFIKTTEPSKQLENVQCDSVEAIKSKQFPEKNLSLHSGMDNVEIAGKTMETKNAGRALEIPVETLPEVNTWSDQYPKAVNTKQDRNIDIVAKISSDIQTLTIIPESSGLLVDFSCMLGEPIKHGTESGVSEEVLKSTNAEYTFSKSHPKPVQSSGSYVAKTNSSSSQQFLFEITGANNTKLENKIEVCDNKRKEVQPNLHTESQMSCKKNFEDGNSLCTTDDTASIYNMEKENPAYCFEERLKHQCASDGNPKNYQYVSIGDYSEQFKSAEVLNAQYNAQLSSAKKVAESKMSSDLQAVEICSVQQTSEMSKNENSQSMCQVSTKNAEGKSIAFSYGSLKMGIESTFLVKEKSSLSESALQEQKSSQAEIQTTESSDARSNTDNVVNEIDVRFIYGSY